SRLPATLVTGHLPAKIYGGRYWDRTSDLFGVNCRQCSAERLRAMSRGPFGARGVLFGPVGCCTSLLYNQTEVPSSGVTRTCQQTVTVIRTCHPREGLGPARQIRPMITWTVA